MNHGTTIKVISNNNNNKQIIDKKRLSDEENYDECLDETSRNYDPRNYSKRGAYGIVIPKEFTIDQKADAVINSNSKRSKNDKGFQTPEICNVVCTVSLGEIMELRKILSKYKNVSYKLGFSGINFKLNALPDDIRKYYDLENDTITGLLFKGGKLVCEGAKSIESAISACMQIKELTKGKNFDNFRIVNLVAEGNVGFCIDIKALKLKLGALADYCPETFPGLIYRNSQLLQELNICCIIFQGGSILMTGAKSIKNIYQYYFILYQTLLQYKKEDSKPYESINTEIHDKIKKSILSNIEALSIQKENINIEPRIHKGKGKSNSNQEKNVQNNNNNNNNNSDDMEIDQDSSQLNKKNKTKNYEITEVELEAASFAGVFETTVKSLQNKKREKSKAVSINNEQTSEPKSFDIRNLNVDRYIQYILNNISQTKITNEVENDKNNTEDQMMETTNNLLKLNKNIDDINSDDDDNDEDDDDNEDDEDDDEESETDSIFEIESLKNTNTNQNIIDDDEIISKKLNNFFK
jgi:TATA-box binding protein (TBP) (component of TFIID and TFIIIB)